ncbi:MAG TPA: AraC family transcriptional regulator [Candidatus Binatia bacterium]
MPPGLSGTLYTLEEHFLYVGPLLRSEPHAHHAGQIMWVPDGIALRTREEPPRQVTFAVIRPDEVHEHGDAARAAVLWIDGEDPRWRAVAPLPVAQAQDGQAGAASSSLTEDGAPVDRLSPDAAEELARRLSHALGPNSTPRPSAPRHPAVRRMCALLDAGATTPSHEICLTSLARRSGLSERRLREVFLRETGLTPRAYLRWRRLRRAVERIRQGASLTAAAVDAGFADGAHFSRVFHAQFGMAPQRAFASLHFGGAPARV